MANERPLHGRAAQRQACGLAVTSGAAGAPAVETSPGPGAQKQ